MSDDFFGNNNNDNNLDNDNVTDFWNTDTGVSEVEQLKQEVPAPETIFAEPESAESVQNVSENVDPVQQNRGNPGSGYNNYHGNRTERDSEGFGIASLVLGIVSLVFFCTCCNIVTAILAIVFGVIQITSSKKKGLAIGGIVTAVLSIVLAIGALVLLSANRNLVNSIPNDMQNIMPYMENGGGNDYGIPDLDIPDLDVPGSGLDGTN